jgi:hypothetical protein
VHFITPVFALEIPAVQQVLKQQYEVTVKDRYAIPANVLHIAPGIGKTIYPAPRSLDGMERECGSASLKAPDD